MFQQISIYTGLFLILLGFNIGILSGFFGVGGCFILTPLLNILGLPMANAVGTGLFFAVFVSFLGGIKHYFAGNALIRLSIIVGLISFIGIRISQPLVLYLDKVHLAGFYIRLIYIVLLIILGISTWKKKITYSGESTKYQQNQLKLFKYFQGIPPKILIESYVLPFSIWPIAIIAFVIGCLQGFLGVGGGFILVPVLIVFLNIKTHHAVGTSLVTILISSVFATFLYLKAGKVLIPVSLLLGIGSLAGVSLGVNATLKISGDKLKNLYSLFLLLTSGGIILKSIGYHLFSMVYMFILSLGIGLLILVRYSFVNNNFPK